MQGGLTLADVESWEREERKAWFEMLKAQKEKEKEANKVK